jgi:hypothetical protein
MTDKATTPLIECPACGTRGGGRFCAECAAPLQSAACRECALPYVVGARFCHHCGASVHSTPRSHPEPAGAAPSRLRRSYALPWAVGVIAFVALAGFVVWQRSAVNTATGEVAAPLESASDGGVASRAPDISAMSPRERAERLYDRAMMAKQSGKLDSATFFATMATMAYGQLGELTIDDHYDLGRLALLTGSASLAGAEADTMLAIRPTHLLGLMLAEDAARASGLASKANAFHARLLANAAKERRAALPEYREHASDLALALGGADTSRVAKGAGTSP